MTQHLVVQVLIFLGVMIAVTVVPALFLFAGVVIMKAWMSRKGLRSDDASTPDTDEGELEAPA